MIASQIFNSLLVGGGGRMPYLSSETHHDEEQGLQEHKLMFHDPLKGHPFHKELDCNASAQLRVPSTFIGQKAQTFHQVFRKRQLVGLKGKQFWLNGLVQKVY